MSKFFKGVFIFIFCLPAFLCISCSKKETSNPNQNNLGTGSEEKQKWNGSIEDDFTDDGVLVYIKSEYCDSIFTATDFPDLELEKIECKTRALYDKKKEEGNLPKNFHHIYFLILKNKGKENVIKAIRICEKLDFIDYVCPNLIYSFDDSIE